jgi:hypothetical protein
MLMLMLALLASDADAASADVQENLVGQDNNPQALSSLRSIFRFAAVSPTVRTAVEVLQAEFGEVVGVSAQAASIKVRLPISHDPI